MEFYNLSAFCNTRFYAPNDAPNPQGGEGGGTITLPVKKVEDALIEAHNSTADKTKEELQEEINRLKEEIKNSNIDPADKETIAKFNLTTDDLAIIGLLIAFLAVVNGPAAIPFGAFLTIAAGLDIKSSELGQYSKRAKELQKENPQEAPGTDPKNPESSQPFITQRQPGVG